MTFKNGDEVLITHEGRIVPATIVMISRNQVSALIEFDALLGGHAGTMPIMRHDREKGIYRSIIDGTEVTLGRKE
jgi:hypothetical protein